VPRPKGAYRHKNTGLGSARHETESVVIPSQFNSGGDFVQRVSVLEKYVYVNAAHHVDFVTSGRKSLSYCQARISVRRVCRQRIRLVHFTGFVLVKQGGSQLRRFRIHLVTQ
jgi:hypothetical protein